MVFQIPRPRPVGFNGLTCPMNTRYLTPFQGARQSRALWTRLFTLQIQVSKSDDGGIQLVPTDVNFFSACISPGIQPVLDLHNH